VYGKPGEVSEEYDIMWRAQYLKNHETAFVGVCLHFIQEDQPEATGRAIADWYRCNLAKNRNVWCTNAQP
jgi:haloalkane dehalogenase